MLLFHLAAVQLEVLGNRRKPLLVLLHNLPNSLLVCFHWETCFLPCNRIIERHAQTNHGDRLVNDCLLCQVLAHRLQLKLDCFALLSKQIVVQYVAGRSLQLDRNGVQQIAQVFT